MRKDKKDYIKKYLPFIMLIIPAVFLYRMILFGEVVTTNDELERHPINQWRDSYLEDQGDMPQWFPNLFSGMPSYGGYIYMTGDPTKVIRNTLFFNPGMKVWFFMSITSIGMFMLLRYLKISTIGCILGGLIAGLTPYSFGLVNAGHLNKIHAMAYVPWAIFSVFHLMKKPSLIVVLFFSLVTALQLWANHPQIVYYTWMVIGFYFVWETFNSLSNNLFSFKSSILKFCVISGSLLISIIMVSDPYWDIYSFQKHSNRGESSVLNESKKNNVGTDWDYATQWSFDPREMISFIFPYHYGLQNFPDRDLKSVAYWGYMPFTQSTHYLGLIAIILTILGSIIKKPDRMHWFLLSTTFLTLLTGFGSSFPILYKPFFELLPFFSKFRIPSMIYVLLALTIPVLAAKGYDIIIKTVEDKIVLKKVLFVSGFIGLLSILSFLFGDIVFEFNNAKDGRFNPSIINQIKSIRIDLFQKGALLAFFVSIGFLGLVWSLFEKKISIESFGCLLIVLTVTDLYVINSEFISVKPAKDMINMFKMDETVKHLLQDEDYFRIFPADRLGSNKYSYWNLESIGGYRPIKLRNYQDLMDAGGFSRPHILNMLNVKYVLTKKKINNKDFIPVPNLIGVYENKKVLPKAWFVNDIKSVKSKRESLMQTLLVGSNPAKSAVVLNYEGEPISKLSKGSVNMISRNENKIILNAESDQGGLIVLSEIYYKPGWRAFVNGEKTSIYQTNHILRSVYIPDGKSEIVFEYDHTSWKNARLLSRTIFFIVIFVLGVLFYKEKNSKKYETIP